MSQSEEKNAILKIGEILCDQNRPLKERFRALFTLRNLKGELSVECISRAFSDPSALLKHECAYCLGQMQDESALPILENILRNTSEDPIVRHEAAEALGAIGSSNSISLLKEYINDPEIVVSETCQLAMRRINWATVKVQSDDSTKQFIGVDPTPADEESNLQTLQSTLLSEDEELYNRYKAMFALRNIGSQEAVLHLCKGLKSGGALYRHEIAFVLGQMQDESSIESLFECLGDTRQHEMVRHECAEALGSIATVECMDILKKYLSDPSRVVRESCEVALDMCEYENNGEFQYADTLIKAKS